MSHFEAIVTGIVAILTVLATVLGLMINLINALKANTATTNRTNTLVNNSHDELVTRVDQLQQTVTDGGGTIPVDPAIGAAQERLAAHAAIEVVPPTL